MNSPSSREHKQEKIFLISRFLYPYIMTLRTLLNYEHLLKLSLQQIHLTANPVLPLGNLCRAFRLTVREVKVMHMPPNPFIAKAKKMRMDRSEGERAN